MAAIEPVRQDVERPGRVKKNPAGLRLWHWANALIICGSLLTVLINSTLFNKNKNGAFIKSTMSSLSATEQQAGRVLHTLSDQIWNVHIYFGYFLAGFLLFRILLELFRKRHQRFISKLRAAWHGYRSRQADVRVAKHELVVKLIYLAFYILLVVIALTGLSLVFKNQLGLPKNVSHSIKAVHGFCMYLVLAFITVHLAGVFLAERGSESGIVSDMINGGRAANEVTPEQTKNKD